MIVSAPRQLKKTEAKPFVVSSTEMVVWNVCRNPLMCYGQCPRLLVSIIMFVFLSYCNGIVRTQNDCVARC